MIRRTDCRQEKGLQLVGKNIKLIIPDFKSLISFSPREISELNSLGIEITRTKDGFTKETRCVLSIPGSECESQACFQSH